MAIVQTGAPITSAENQRVIGEIVATYPFCRTETIATTAFQRPISTLVIGTGPRKVLFTAAHHANEWLTATVLLKFAEELAQALQDLTGLEEKDSVLVVGLGNRAVTPDALGPQTVDRVFLTRHLIRGLPDSFGSCRSVSGVAPGVLATTGVESLELVRGAAEHVKPHCILCVDALAAGSMDRLCRTVQLSDAGIAPGSGVGNCRAAFSKDSLSVPVYAIGVPTVVDGGSDRPMILTPRDIDEQIRYLSRVLAGGINLFLHPNFAYDDFTQFVPM